MPRFAANLSMLFTEVEMTSRFKLAAQAGFRGVEMLFPYDWPVTELANLLRQNGLEQVLFNLPPGGWNAGERGIASLPGREAAFCAGVEQALDYANALGCRQLHCMAGRRDTQFSASDQRRLLIENVRYAARAAAAHGITINIEAINSRVDMPGYLVDDVPSALQLIEAVGEPNVRFQFDVHHLQVIQGDLLRTLERLLPVIGHVQFADNPGRHEPGTGEIYFDRVFGRLDELGYTGWVSAEYRPSASTAESLHWLPRASG